MGLTLITAPAAEPVTTEEMKTHLRVTQADDDGYIATLITAARRWTENFTGRALCEQAWEWRLDGFPARSSEALEIPLPPLLDLTKVSYVDTAGVTQPWTDYQLDPYAEPARLLPAYADAWPTTRDVANAVTIEFEAGYESSADSPPDYAANVPGDVKAAIKIIAAHLYTNREMVAPVQLFAVPFAAEWLLAPYRVLRF